MRREGRPNFTGWRSGERWPEERRLRELTSWIPIHLVPALTRCVRRLVLHRSLTLPSGHGDRRQPTLGVNKPSVWLIEAAFLVLVFDADQAGLPALSSFARYSSARWRAGLRYQAPFPALSIRRRRLRIA